MQTVASSQEWKIEVMGDFNVNECKLGQGKPDKFDNFLSA